MRAGLDALRSPRNVELIIHASFGSDTLPKPRIPSRLTRCTATRHARVFCEHLHFAERLGTTWQCTMSPNACPPHIAQVYLIDEGHSTCPYRSEGYRPGPSIPQQGWHLTLERFSDASVAYVRHRVWELAHEDSPNGRVAFGITADDLSSCDRDLDVRWLHAQPRLTLDERTNLWRQEAQRRLCCHITKLAKGETCTSSAATAVTAIRKPATSAPPATNTSPFPTSTSSTATIARCTSAS